jgi:voltage-gated potassium channel
MQLPRIRVYIAVILLVSLVVIGTLGYYTLEAWSLSESLYMAIITLTTVGFGEVRPLSPAGQHFTIVFLVVSVATFMSFSVQAPRLSL